MFLHGHVAWPPSWRKLKKEELNDNTKEKTGFLDGTFRLRPEDASALQSANMTADDWRARHVALPTEENRLKNWRGKKTKKLKKVPHVNIIGMGTIGFSLDYSFIRVINYYRL